MSMETWGLVPKAQNDTQTIDEAIAAAITDHEVDPHAHQGDGESLQSHKNESVIDHPADSLVTDKYLADSITEDKILHNKSYKETTWQTLDAILQDIISGGSITSYFGMVKLTTANTNNAHAALFFENNTSDFNLAEKNPVMQAIIRWPSNATTEATVGIGDYGSDVYGFKVIDGVIYALAKIDGTDYTTEIMNVVSMQYNTYRVKVYSGEKIEYYIDENLVHTDTTHISEATELDYDFVAIVITKTTATRSLYLKRTIVYQDL